MHRTSKDRMTDEMFFGLIDQMSQWTEHPKVICPFLTNEPFADPRIYDFCCYINQKLPKTDLIFFTNGSLFTESNLIKMARVKKIKQIYVSLHHSEKAAYEAELGLQWEHVLSCVRRLIEHCQEAEIDMRILRVRDGDLEKDKAFTEFCKTEFNQLAYLSYRYNWKGDIPSSFEDQWPDIVCPRTNNLHILCDGRVALCCLDQKGEFGLGDTREETLLDIFNGPIARAYRTRVKRLNTPCNRCNMH